MPQRQQVTVDVHAILERGDDVLLCLRQGTGYRDGWYCLPSGHLEEGETVVECAIRETREEVGVRIDPAALRPATVLHHLNPEGQPRGFFFATTQWTGTIVNAEPHKCAAVDWFPAHRLPGNTVPYTVAGLRHYHRNQGIGTHGRPTPPQDLTSPPHPHRDPDKGASSPRDHPPPNATTRSRHPARSTATPVSSTATPRHPHDNAPPLHGSSPEFPGG